MTRFFYGCNLSTLPEGLFNNNNIISMAAVFGTNINLSTLPSNLFVNCSKCTDFSYMFNECQKVQLRDDMFNVDHYVGKTINVRKFCYRNTANPNSPGIMQPLWLRTDVTWNNGPLTERPFRSPSESTSTISNWNDVSADWKS
jgi:hypothetical protein